MECEAIREIASVVGWLGLFALIEFIFWLAYKAGE